MSLLINNSKFGDCTRCPEKDTECRKRGKYLVCLSCCKTEDTQKQIQKANLKNRVRSLGNKQRIEGNEDSSSRQNLINDLDYVFSRIVRLRAADQYGNCECFTCGDRKHWSLIQAGHFQKRGNMGLRFDFRNVKPQCKKCNELNSGEIRLFSERLDRDEAGLSETLVNEARIVFSYGISELKELLLEFRGKLKPLEQKIKNVSG